MVKISAVLVAISVVWVAVSVCKAVVFGSSMSNLPCNEVISVIKFVEPTIKFSAVKSPSTTTSPVISKVDISGNVPFVVSAKVSLGISVILGLSAKEPV